jgi:mannose-6-phosphate isomerase-like protein (cupin superfamily)
VIGGSGKVVVDGEDVPVWPGVFVAVTPNSTRYVQAGDAGLVYIAVCTSPSAY